ncbi:PRAME family member 12-like [Hyaena hyaena]|uniref:PRAME family member 12-like n=1 Tax=Hyaena hyaena TaxID=95912 RepID=UPI001924BE00|nr:PRAME family member 12-like [Hyaena hyaena]
MWTWTPPRLLELAGKSLLRDEDLAIAALENLPTELFPPLFMAAYASGCNETLKAMVQAWPFARLPLGGLVQMPDQRTLQAVLGGLDLLLARKVRPRRWKLRVLDLRNTSQNFWSVWSAATTHECLWVGPVAEDSLRMKEPLGPLVVFIDLCLRHKALDEVFAHLISWATKRRKSLQLCCKKVTIFRMPIQNIKKVLNKVQLDCILEVEVKFTWKLSTLGTFASYLGQMTNLQRLVLSHIHEPSKEERQQITKFTSQLLQLHHLRKLHMDSPTFLVGCLDQMLRCLKAPLETLSITHCRLTELDLACLSQCLSISQLKELALNGVKLTSFSLKHLQVLLDTVAATLQDLELEYCDLSDAHLEAILPAVSRCHQLRAFSIRGNPLSMAIVGRLLHQTTRLRRLSLEVYPAPLESYDSRGTIHLGRLAQAQAELREILKDLGRSRTIWLSTGSCPRCGSNVVCVSVPLTHPINGLTS